MKIPSETTPIVATEEIINAAKTVAPFGEMIYVSVSAEKAARKRNCFHNVEDVVLKEGGNCVTGWAIWQWANILIDFEAHAVWQKPTGELVDITPHEGEEKILFLPDSSIQYNGYSIPSIRFALTSSSFVAELIELQSIQDNFFSQYLADTEVSFHSQSEIADVLMRINEIVQQLRAEVTRNDPCPCQSGLKFKHCCGRYV